MVLHKSASYLQLNVLLFNGVNYGVFLLVQLVTHDCEQLPLILLGRLYSCLNIP